MTINFEQDRVESITQIDAAKTLSDKVLKLKDLEDEIANAEESVNKLKEKARILSQVEIPAMMQEMHITKLKLRDGESVEVKPFYSASISPEVQEKAFEWLRNNGLGDIIKNDITVTFGRGEDNKAAQYAVLARGQGFEPVQKVGVPKMETSNEKQVAIKKDAPLPSKVMFEDDAHAGFENVKQGSLALPILKLLQNGSAEAQKRNQAYIEGAEPGMLLNTVTKKVYDGSKGIDVVPCHYKLEYQEWSDFGTGSGRPEQIYPDTSDVLTKTTKDAMGKDRLPNGNYILTVGQHFVLISDNGSSETALISMSSSQGKISRKWNAMMMSITLNGKNGVYTPPSFSHTYKLKTVLNSGKGNQWYGYNVEKIGPVQDQAVYERAKQFYQSLANGK